MLLWPLECGWKLQGFAEGVLKVCMQPPEQRCCNDFLLKSLTTQWPHSIHIAFALFAALVLATIVLSFSTSAWFRWRRGAIQSGTTTAMCPTDFKMSETKPFKAFEPSWMPYVATVPLPTSSWFSSVSLCLCEVRNVPVAPVWIWRWGAFPPAHVSLEIKHIQKVCAGLFEHGHLLLVKHFGACTKLPHFECYAAVFDSKQFERFWNISAVYFMQCLHICLRIFVTSVSAFGVQPCSRSTDLEHRAT